MSRTFREWNPDQSWLFPPSPQDWLPDGHLVYFLMDVSEQLDLSPIMEKYDSEKGGKPPYHPRMMLVLLLYSYCIGVFSSRKIVARCETDVAFRVIVGDNIRESGLLKVGRLALDGTKIKANASRHKAMSYDRMLAEEKRLQAEIDELLKQAQAADDAEDAELGRDHRGDELPDELRRRESRLLKIREAKAALEQQARDKAAAEAAIREAEGKPPAKTDPQDAVPDPKAQRNFTDPESKIMKTSSKGWDQCGNAQAVVNENQIIVAADVTDQANDVRQVQPMLDQTITNINQAGVTENIKAFTADAGYFSEANVEVLEQHERVDEAYIATGRLKHHERVAPAPTGRIPAGLSVKEKMARKLRTKKGRAEYARRKAMAEPPFGQIKHCRGFRQFLLRSMEKMKAEWNLVTLTHNLLKLFRSGALATN